MCYGNFTRVARHLVVGFCLYVLREETPTVYKIPLFISTKKPKRFRKPEKPKPKSLMQKIVSALNGSKETEVKEYDSPYGNTWEDEDNALTKEEFGVWE